MNMTSSTQSDAYKTATRNSSKMSFIYSSGANETDFTQK